VLTRAERNRLLKEERELLSKRYGNSILLHRLVP
jgi:hypothetical protein